MHSRRSGFTLIEVMVVLVIIGIIAAMVVPNVINRTDDASVTAARVQIQSIANALELYKLDNRTYPSTQQGLDALVKKPSGNPEARFWKKGGYLNKVPVDPWGNPYQYLSPGTHGAFDLWSFGADGKQGGGDYDKDLGNWE